MGIRFRCHNCEHELHVKDFQAGKRGKCPECLGRFRIPMADSLHSLPLETTLPEGDRDASEDCLEANSTVEQRQLVRSTASSGSASDSIQKEREAFKLDAPTSETAQTPPVRSQPNAGASKPEVTAITSATTSFAAIREAPGAVWYVRPPSGGQFGPASAEVLGQWLSESRVTGESFVWRDGWPEWLVAANVFADFFGPAAIGSTGLVKEPSLRDAAAGESATRPLTETSSPSDRTRRLKRQKRKTSYAFAIGLLAVIAAALVVTLVVVIVMQQNGTSQPTQ